MNVYDFDKTIYDGDSTIDFWVYWLKGHPLSAWRIPLVAFAFLLFRIKLIKREKFKRFFYGFLKDISDCETAVKSFWDKNEKKIKPWYLSEKSSTDVIVSASPEFLISEICSRLNVASISSKVDKNTGKLISKNCRGEEKVVRFFEEFPEAEIENFYSDSKSDIALAKHAKNAYLVKKNQLIKWDIDEKLNKR